jgi:carbon storage regulator
MLVMTRKRGEAIKLGKNITLVVVSIKGEKVRLGIEAPLEMPVHRQEVYDSIQRDNDDRNTDSATH